MKLEIQCSVIDYFLNVGARAILLHIFCQERNNLVTE